jgi:predicted nucleotidyltransferase
VNARTQLGTVARLLNQHGVDAVLIGCAAAALQGAPVTTEDFDFYFRPTTRNVRKLEDLAKSIGTTLRQPHYPLSRMYRISSPQVGVQVDLMGSVLGVKSFESVRSRSTRATIDGSPLKVASLRDIISMKRAANRPKDRAVMTVLEDTLRETQEKQED